MADESLLKDLYSRMPDQSLSINCLQKGPVGEDAVRIIKQGNSQKGKPGGQLERENNLKEQQANEYESLKETIRKKWFTGYFK